MHVKTGSLRDVLIVVVLTVMTSIACTGTGSLPSPGAFSILPDRCPGHDPTTGDTLPTIGFSGESTNIPEYHDCQRFIESTSYLARFAVFAAFRLDTLIAELKRLECSNQPPRILGRNVPQKSSASAKASIDTITLGGARVSGLTDSSGILLSAGKPVGSIDSLLVKTVSPAFPSDGDCRTVTATASWYTIGLAFAMVVSWGGAYAPLAIKSGINCLYFWDSMALKAKMISLGESANLNTACTEVIDPENTEGTVLKVTGFSSIGMGMSDIPPVARWDREPTQNGRMYIGVKCGNQWCEVGPDGLQSSSWYAGSGATTLTRRVFQIKGWYDEQYLAERRIFTGLKPTTVLGRAFPHPDLDQYKLSSFDNNVWLPVAYITINKAHKKYALFDPSEAPGLPGGTNQAFLCRGAANLCIPDTKRQSEVAGCTTSEDDPWYSLVTSASGDSTYECVHRRVHDTTHKIPGTVRWAWSDMDEGRWYSCPGGCCYPN